MKSEDIVYKVGPLSCRGYLAYDETLLGKRPGVLVVHEGWGLSSHAKARASRLASLGYVAFAADMYGDRRQMADMAEMMSAVTALFSDPVEFRARANAGLAALAKVPQVDVTRLGAIGFCFGGSTVLELARSGAKLKGAVSFHGGLSPAQAAHPGTINASILVCTGADDPMVTSAQVQDFENEMRNAGADYQIIVFGDTVHSFTNSQADGSLNPAIRYNERSDKRSWAALERFFNEVFE